MKNNKTTETTFWDQCRGKIVSRKGGWIIGKGAFSHGYDINKDCVGEISYFQLMILNATGKLPEKKLADWLEAAYMGLSWPDSRLWCNQIAALGGTMRCSAAAATGAGLLSADTRLYAQRTLIEGINFITRALAAKKAGATAAEIVAQECARYKGRPYIVGYTRPIANGDERIAPLEKVAIKLGFKNGEHLTLAYQIEAALKAEYGEEMNMNGYASAFLADQGLSAEEAYRISLISTNSGITACYLNALERPPESFLPLRCSDIDYQGPPPRDVPVKES
ncbi:citrate synthase [Desulfuromusa kysingii]|uniref:Citrate synthase n=1 Tax=Desulfuromusa kysingii TaxID=37625 RepID=A0A1H3YJC0_9BACT|nr:hypothetical protein [Desulfuromusa kysingii]SEA11645.1 citrate synthase [Desulfuromusa kysingii]